MTRTATRASAPPVCAGKAAPDASSAAAPLASRPRFFQAPIAHCQRQGVVGRAAGVFQHAEHVVAVEDAEVLPEAEPLAVAAQHAHTKRMEGADRQRRRGACADQALGALAHLGRRLVGEGDRGNLRGRVPCFEQSRDLVHDDARLARAGAGEHEAGSAKVMDRLELRRVERRRQRRRPPGRPEDAGRRLGGQRTQ
jgi:hypothetical protein